MIGRWKNIIKVLFFIYKIERLLENFDLLFRLFEWIMLWYWYWSKYCLCILMCNYWVYNKKKVIKNSKEICDENVVI